LIKVITSQGSSPTENSYQIPHPCIHITMSL
jgi:hypothetical protein